MNARGRIEALIARCTVGGRKPAEVMVGLADLREVLRSIDEDRAETERIVLAYHHNSVPLDPKDDDETFAKARYSNGTVARILASLKQRPPR